MAMSIFRRFSICSSSLVAYWTRVSLVTPSTRSATVGPKCLAISSWVAGVSSMHVVEQGGRSTRSPASSSRSATICGHRQGVDDIGFAALAQLALVGLLGQTRRRRGSGSKSAERLYPRTGFFQMFISFFEWSWAITSCASSGRTGRSRRQIGARIQIHLPLGGIQAQLHAGSPSAGSGRSVPAPANTSRRQGGPEEALAAAGEHRQPPQAGQGVVLRLSLPQTAAPERASRRANCSREGQQPGLLLAGQRLAPPAGARISSRSAASWRLGVSEGRRSINCSCSVVVPRNVVGLEIEGRIHPACRRSRRTPTPS